MASCGLVPFQPQAVKSRCLFSCTELLVDQASPAHTLLTAGALILWGPLSALQGVEQHACPYPLNARSTPSVITTDVPQWPLGLSGPGESPVVSVWFP